jgi:hypothetical protein
MLMLATDFDPAFSNCVIGYDSLESPLFFERLAIAASRQPESAVVELEKIALRSIKTFCAH